MIIRPRVRGFLCTTSHPLGCEENVRRQIEYVKVKDKITGGAARVLVIGASTGYGLSSRIVAAYGCGASTLGVFFEKPGSEKKTGSAGWYNSAAFHRFAEADGLYARSINGDAFSKEVKLETIEAISKDLGQVDLVVYSLAAPRRLHPVDGEIYSSTLKPIGSSTTQKGVNTDREELQDYYLEAATQEEIDDTVMVMGGEDWQMWMECLDSAGVLATGLFYSDIDNKIGKIIATVDPNQPQSATGNVGPSKQMGWFTRASVRLNQFNLPNAIFSGRVGLFDSEILNPFINQKVRTGSRGFGNVGFRQDITSMNLSYGIDYNHSFWGGYYDIDIFTRTRNDRRRTLDIFVQKIWFDDWVFRLESDNTLGASRCRYRERYKGTTMDGNIELIQDSCSSRYHRLILSIQTTF